MKKYNINTNYIRFTTFAGGSWRFSFKIGFYKEPAADVFSIWFPLGIPFSWAHEGNKELDETINIIMNNHCENEKI